MKYINVKDNVLIVGCGNSTVSMCLYDAGYRYVTFKNLKWNYFLQDCNFCDSLAVRNNIGLSKSSFHCRNITNIDISHIVIKQMRDINATMRPKLVYLHMDATQMTFADNAFSVVLDKGTLDTLMPDTKEGTISNVNKYFKVQCIN